MQKIEFKLERYVERVKRSAKKAPAHYFQSRALAFVEEFKVVEKELRSGIFGWFRRRPDKAEAAYRNMQGKKFKDPATYFLKLMSL